MWSCASCGTEYPDDVQQQWGKTLGVGAGPQPRCVTLADREGKPVLDYADVAAGIAAPDREEPLHVCGGPIVFSK